MKVISKYLFIIPPIIFILAYFINPYFIYLALVCLWLPIVAGFFKKADYVCKYACPRGSFLSTFLTKISFSKKYPKLLNDKTFRNTLAFIFITFFIACFNNYVVINKDTLGFANFFLIMVSSTFLLSIVLGVIYKPRSWCKICPARTTGKYISS